MMAVATWLMRRPWLLVSGALALALGMALAQAYLAGGQRDAARAEVARLRADTVRQNEAIAVWQAAAEQQQTLASQAQQRAAQIRVVTQTHIQRVLTAPVPSECPAAIRWGAEQAQHMVAEWGE